MFALTVLMEMYREGQKELHCFFVDLEKAYDKAPREERCYLLYETTTTTTVYFNEVVFPSVLGLTSPMAFPQHSPS